MIPPLAALFAWPALTAIFFNSMRLPLAIVVTVLAGYLVLPEATKLDLPGLPALNKGTIPVLSALLMIAIVSGREQVASLAGAFPRSWIVRLLVPIMAAGAFLTVITNPDPLIYGPTFLPGLRPYDAFSAVLWVAMMLLPLVLARKYLAHPERHVMLLQVFCIAGLGYSLLALFEVRMSPQLNNWVYGFFSHVWAQHVRPGGGYRPIVFLEHGLLVSIFFSATVLAALGLARVDRERRGLFLVAALWLTFTLFMTKSLGAFVITLVLGPLVLFLSARAQLLAAAIIAGLFLSYPMARSGDLLPLDRILEITEGLSEDRAGSFETRLKNEEILLDKASERPLFGWGGWGRSRIFDERGTDITITDGYWIIALGVGGWTRYLTEFGLLAIPILLVFFNRRRYRLGIETSALALILAGNLVDMIPNSSITPLSWLLAGALWGRVELGAVQAAAPAEAAGTEPVPPRSGYARPALARKLDPPAPAPDPTETDPPRPIYSRYSRQSPPEQRTRTSPKRS